MTEIIRAKADQHPQIAAALEATGDDRICETNTWHDNTWGDCRCARCANRTGQNRLGQIWMQIRNERRRGA